MKQVLCAFFALVMLVQLPGEAEAVNFYDGARAPKGLYLLTYTSLYTADDLTDSHGNKVKKRLRALQGGRTAPVLLLHSQPGPHGPCTCRLLGNRFPAPEIVRPRGHKRRRRLLPAYQNRRYPAYALRETSHGKIRFDLGRQCRLKPVRYKAHDLSVQGLRGFQRRRGGQVFLPARESRRSRLTGRRALPAVPARVQRDR